MAKFFQLILIEHEWYHVSLIIDESDSQCNLLRASLEKILNIDNGKQTILVNVQTFSSDSILNSNETAYDKYLLHAKRHSRGRL